VFGLGGFHFGEGFGEGGGVGDHGVIVEAIVGGGHAGIGFIDEGFDAIELTLFEVGELFLAGSRGRGAGGGGALRAVGGGLLVGDVALLDSLPLFPLLVVGEDAGVGVAVEAEDDVGDAVEHVAVVGDEDEGSLEFEEGFFEDLEGGDVEVVGGLVEHEEVGGLEHKAGDEDAAALAAAEALDGLVELVAGEEEFCGVAGDVDDAVLVDDGVGVGREGAAEGEGWVDFAELREVDDAEAVGALDGAGGRGDFSGHGAEDGGFAAAVGADEAELHAVGDAEADAADDLAATERDGDVFEFDEALGLAVGGVELDAGGGGAGALVDVGELADEFVGVIDAGLGLGGAGLGASAEPVDFGLDAVAEALLHLGLGFHVELAAFEEFRVGAAYAEHTFGVDTAQLDDLAGYVLEEIAIVGDDDAGESSAAENGFEPLDAFEVEVVGGLVEEEDVGLGDHGLGDGEALAPAAGETGGVGVHADRGVRAVVREPCAAEGFAEALLALIRRHACTFQSRFHDVANGEAGGVFGDLADVTDAGAAANGDFTGVGLDLASEDLPAPLGPIRPIRSPSFTAKEIFSKRGVAPKRLDTPCALRIGGITPSLPVKALEVLRLD
jgi:hypothetical protein